MPSSISADASVNADAEIIAGQAVHVNYKVIPGVIYSSPEVPTVRKTEEHLKSDKRNFNIGKFPFIANSRAKVYYDTEGFVLFFTDANLAGANFEGANLEKTNL